MLFSTTSQAVGTFCTWSGPAVFGIADAALLPVRNPGAGSDLCAMSGEEEIEAPPAEPWPEAYCRVCNSLLLEDSELLSRRQRDRVFQGKPALCGRQECFDAEKPTGGKGKPVQLTPRDRFPGPYDPPRKGKGKGKPDFPMQPKGGKGHGEYDAREQTHRHALEVLSTVLQHLPKNSES